MLLSLGRPCVLAVPSNIVSVLGPNDAANRLMAQLQQRSWAAADDWLPVDILDGLRRELLELYRARATRSAGVGRAANRRLLSDVRSDQVHWMDPANLSEAQSRLWHAVDELRVQMNRTLFLGLRRFEGHLTVYPPGAHYHKHLDRFADTGHRMVSFVVYLNRRWEPPRGGALRLYDPAAPDTVMADVWPSWGRVVVFLSATVPHEVLTTHRHRLSATGWFRDDDVL